MNYYNIMPSAANLSCSLGWKYAHSALLIGSTNVTTLFAIFYHTYRINAQKDFSYKNTFLFSAICPLIGNIMYAKSYNYKSFAMAIAGRLLIGFSSIELVNKQVIVTFSPKNDLVTEFSAMRVAQMGGILLGILIGTLYSSETILEFVGDQINTVTMSSYLMAFSWFLQFLGLVICSFPKVYFVSSSPPGDRSSEINLSASEHEVDKGYLLPGLFTRGRSLSDSTGADGLKRSRTQEQVKDHTKASETNPPLIPTPSLSIYLKRIVSILKKTKKLMLHNIALPVTFLVYGFVCLSTEVFFTSCVIITHRYFHLPGVWAGAFLALLAALIVPTNFFISHASICVGERVVMKKALTMMFVGVLCFVNYQALYHLFRNLRAVLRNDLTDTPLTTYYDWNLGLMQYCISVLMMFLSSVSLEGVSLSLMSKSSPGRLNRSPLNCSVMAPLAACLSKILGNSIIILVSFSHRAINTDIVNSISFLLIGLCYCCYHVVKKHYFFLNDTRT